jgi:hypothetical protein
MLLEADLRGQTTNRVLKLDIQTVLEILPLARARSAAMFPLAQEVREEITQIADPSRLKIKSPKIKAAGPASRLWSPGPGGKCVVAELVVSTALLGIAQDLVGLADFLELRFR